MALKLVSKRNLKVLLWISAAVFYHCYFLAALVLNFRRATPLLVITASSWFLICYYRFIKPSLKNLGVLKPNLRYFESASEIWDKYWRNWCCKLLLYLFLISVVLVFLIVDARGNISRFISFVGLLGYLLMLYFMSHDRSRINWRIVCWGIGLQFIFGLIVLKWPTGFAAFNWIAEQITAFLDYVVYGTSFVYGFLAQPPNICGMTPVFAFSLVQTVVFFNAVVGILYYYGIIQVIIRKLGWFMQLTMGTTAAESMAAVSDTFLGMCEGPLMIAPYIPLLTQSEMNAILTSGFTCIAGSAFAIYSSFGACPIHLLSHSIMAAPASLAVAKMLLPETEASKTKMIKDTDNGEKQKSKECNVLEAISTSASQGTMIILHIVANLIAFLALLHFANNVLAWLGSMVGVDGFSFEVLLSYLFLPLAYMMGCDGTLADVMVVSRLMGIKTFLNEFIAYKRMGDYIKQGLLSPRNQLIATYALCGFSNIGSIGVILGALGSICPERKSDVAKLSVVALIGGSIGCFMTACVAGILLDERGPCMASIFYTSNANCTKID